MAVWQYWSLSLVAVPRSVCVGGTPCAPAAFIWKTCANLLKATSHHMHWIATVVSKAVPPPPTLTSIPNTVKSFRLVMVNYKIPNALVLFTVHVFGIKLYYHAQKCFWERAPARPTFAFTCTITTNTWLLIAGCIKQSCKLSPCFFNTVLILAYQLLNDSFKFSPEEVTVVQWLSWARIRCNLLVFLLVLCLSVNLYFVYMFFFFI